MNERERDILLNRLLAGRDEPSVVEREALWQRIAATAGRGNRRRTWLGGFSLLALAAAALWLLFVPEPELGVRGGDRGTLELTCLREDVPSTCAPGRTLVMEIGVPESKPFVAAFLERADGVVVWVTPDASGVTAPLDEERTLGVRLGEAAPLGRSVAVVVFNPEPIGREGLKAGLEGEPPAEWQIIERGFEVVEGERE